jgi:NAD(P)-dependent dehydrogenase (short-subunit alcohol dehydrogenase family)
MSESRERRVIVTGGASGLGAAVAGRLTTLGDLVSVLDLKPPPEDVPPVADVRLVDLADTRAAAAATLEALTALAGVDAVVCCAGTDACGDLADVAAADWERVIAVNLLGTVAVVRAALPHLQRPEGRVVTVASTLGLRALPAATAYCASKFGIVGFSRALAAETGGRPAVTCVMPGGMNTAFFDGRDAQFKPPPDAHLNDPRDVAAAIAFALDQPPGCEIRELVVCPSGEPSWP